MPEMNEHYLNGIADAGAELINFIALVDETETEIGDRQPVTWTGAGVDNPAGTIRPSQDIIFTIPISTTVRGWRGFSLENGGTSYGGKDFDENPENWEHFVHAGELKLIAAETGISHTVPE